MSSIYDRTSNIYQSNFGSFELTNSGFFSLPDAPAKLVTIHNHQASTTYSVEIAKVEPHTINFVSPLSFPWESSSVTTEYITAYGQYEGGTSSGSAYITGMSLPIEDGFSFTVRGISNTNQIAIRKSVSNHPDLNISYVAER